MKMKLFLILLSNFCHTNERVVLMQFMALAYLLGLSTMSLKNIVPERIP